MFKVASVSSSLIFLFRNREIYSRSHPRLRFRPNPSAVAFYDFLDDGEPHSRSFVFASLMELLKDHENSVQMLRFNADAIVCD